MAKVRWTDARWAKRAQKARARAKSIRAPVRQEMMLEMAEFYDRLAKLTRDFKRAGGGPFAEPRELSKAPTGAAHSLAGAKQGTLSIERKRPAPPRTSKRPQGKRHCAPQKPASKCAVSESDLHQGMFAQDQAPATLEV
jgi:hypothetical protein